MAAMKATTTTRERPVIFSGPMVRALLEGRKTQTRRVLKASDDFTEVCRVDGPAVPGHFNCTCETCRIEEYPFWRLSVSDGGATQCQDVDCPYGVPGDRLWVREAWRYADWTEDGEPHIQYAADGYQRLCNPPFDWADRVYDTWAKLSDPANYKVDGKAADRKWRPSIHMPRWASRITLEVTGVKVERLQAISTEDAFHEGIGGGELDCPRAWECSRPYGWPGLGAHDDPQSQACGGRPYRECSCVVPKFSQLWDTLNGKTHPWSSDPWVWAISFRRVEGDS